MTKSKIFIGSGVSFMVGVLVGSLVSVASLWLGVAAAALCALCALLPRDWRIVVVFSLAFVCGMWRIHSSLSQPSEFTSWYGEKQDFEGVIVSDIDVRTDKQLLTVRPNGISQNILITVTKGKAYFYGDRVWVQGKVTEPKSFNDFDYRGYLERSNIYAVMSYPKVVTLQIQQANKLIYSLLTIKSWASNRIVHRLPMPEGDLLLGILIGARKALPQNVVDSFTATGTSHIIAVSGFNISIIVGALGGLLAKLVGRKTSFWISLLFMVAFIIIAGVSSSVVRAGIMGGLLLLSFNIGRLYAITPSVVVSAVVMLLINPRILFWDASFQLSFAATLGIIYGVPLLEAATEKIPKLFGIKEAVLVTFAASVSTLPLILLTFGRLSIVAIIVNVLVVPLVPLVMLLGAGILLPFVGVGLAMLTHWCLWYMLVVIQWFAHLRFASVTLQISAVTFGILVALILGMYILLWIHVGGRNKMRLDVKSGLW